MHKQPTVKEALELWVGYALDKERKDTTRYDVASLQPDRPIDVPPGLSLSKFHPTYGYSIMPTQIEGNLYTGGPYLRSREMTLTAWRYSGSEREEGYKTKTRRNLDLDLSQPQDVAFFEVLLKRATHRWRPGEKPIIYDLE